MRTGYSSSVNRWEMALYAHVTDLFIDVPNLSSGTDWTTDIDREKRCPCGSIFQVIERIEGRSDDVIRLPRLDQPNQSGWLFPDYVSLAVTAALPEVEDSGLCRSVLQTQREYSTPLATGSEAFLGRMQKELLQICDRSGLIAPSLRLSPWPEEQHLKSEGESRD